MKRFFLLTTVVALATTSGAYASTHNHTTSNTADTVSLHSIQQVEVTAVRAKENSPFAHSELSVQQIESRNYGEDIPALVAELPSVVTSSESGTGIGSTSLRVRGVDATRINVTLNGVPMNDAETHSVYWYDTPDLASSVGSLQLQRGVGSSTVGTGAFGASLNMTSAPLSSEFSGRASLSYGSFNTAKQEVALSSGLLGGRWIVEGRLSHIASDGYVERASSDLSSYMVQAGYYKGNTIVKLLSFGGKARVYLTYTGVTAEQMAKNRRYNPEGEIIIDGKVVGHYTDHTDNYTQLNNQLVVSHIFNDKWRINATAHYTFGDGYYRNYKNDQKLAKYGFAPVEVDGVSVARTNLLRKKSMRNDFGGVVASATYTADKLSLIFGGAASLYDGVHFGEISDLVLVPDFATAEYYRNYTSKWDASCYVKVDWRVARGLSLYADVQYRHITHIISGVNDNYDDTTGAMQALNINRRYNFLNPKIGVHYSFAEHHSAYASAAVGQKEPTRNNFTDIQGGEFPRAEQLLDLEMGYGYHTEWVSLSANLYYMLYRDQLVQTGELSDTGELLSRNVPESYRRGVELSAEVYPTKWLSLGGHTTLCQNHILGYTDYIDGTPFERGRTTIAYSPAATAAVWVDAHHKGFAARLVTRYVGKQYLTNGQYEDLSLPRYCVTDLHLGYTLRTKRVERVQFGVKISNLFNAHYASSGYGGSWMEGPTLAERKSWAYYFPQAGISALGSITVHF